MVLVIIGILVTQIPTSASSDRQIPLGGSRFDAKSSLQDGTPVPSPLPVGVSDDGLYGLFSNPLYQGLWLVDLTEGNGTALSDAAGAGRYASFSEDDLYVCYKSFQRAQGDQLQASMLFDMRQQRIVNLSSWVELAGIPSVAQDGTVAYTAGTKLHVLDPSGASDEFDLGLYTNLIAISPDGSMVAFCDEQEQVTLLSLEDASRRLITDRPAAYWNPQFSPSGVRLLVNTINGDIAWTDVSLDGGPVEVLGKGENAIWVSEDAVCMLEKEIVETQSVVASHRVLVNPVTRESTRTLLGRGDVQAAFSGDTVLLTTPDLVGLYTVSKGGLISSEAVSVPTCPLANLDTATYSPAGFVKSALTGVPYVHQVYDTPDSFNGYWACSATSALMALQSFNILPIHTITVSYPYSHISNYGWYISSAYSYNGYTYNLSANDASGNPAYGGYGFMYRTDGSIRTRMSTYITQHGATSSVDDSPSWSEFTTDIDTGYPVVFRTMLTEAGHYVTGTGYVSGYHTGIFNDPYGNKNSGYMNYSGAGAYYDWPGYNNGYQNLTQVLSFIYCRHSAADLSASVSPTTTPKGGTVTANWSGFTGNVNVKVMKGGAFWVYANTNVAGTGSQVLDTGVSSPVWEIRNDYFLVSTVFGGSISC